MIYLVFSLFFIIVVLLIIICFLCGEKARKCDNGNPYLSRFIRGTEQAFYETIVGPLLNGLGCLLGAVAFILFGLFFAWVCTLCGIDKMPLR